MSKYGQPHFEHDCDCCVFLGTHTFEYPHGEVTCDLYFHKNEMETTVISRHGDDGPQYSSGLAFAFTGDSPDLTLAAARAFRDGLLTPADCVKEHCG